MPRSWGLDPNFTIYDTADSRQVLCSARWTNWTSTPRCTRPRRIAAAISWAKNNLITPEQLSSRGRDIPLGHVVARVYPAYQARLLASSAVDFDDLLLHVATLLRENPETRATLDERYRYILVDEYQDTNLAQYTIVRGTVDRPSEPGGHRRSGPVDLRLARCQPEQHSRLRARLSRRARRQAGAKLPQHASASCAWPTR